MQKFLFLVTVLSSFISLPVLGAQNIQFDPIGFSPLGKYFSFEEYGLNEASGNAYSKIYIIDIAQLSQVIGTPIIYRANIAEQSLGSIRSEALENAGPYLQSLKIEQPAIIVALNANSAPGANNTNIKFELSNSQNPAVLTKTYQLNLEIFDAVAAAECSEIENFSPKGFALYLQALDREEKPEQIEPNQIYRDGVLPRSRQCPSNYGITAIIFPFGSSDLSQGVALISELFASEGAALRNYLAIPLSAKSSVQPGVADTQ